MGLFSESLSSLGGIFYCEFSGKENPANQSQFAKGLGSNAKWGIFTAIFMVTIFVTCHHFLADPIRHVWGSTRERNRVTPSNSFRRDLPRRRGMSWQRAMVAGAISTFFGTIAVVAVLLVSACGATLTDAVGLTRGGSDQDNISECAIASSILATSYYAACRAKAYCENLGWL